MRVTGGRARGAPLVAWLGSLAVATALLGCAAPAERPPVETVHALPMPASMDARHAILDRAGRAIYDALARGKPESLLLDDLALRRLLEPAAATRASALRAGVSARLDVRPEALSVLRGLDYLGICIQGSRVEPPGTPAVGLRDPGWMFDRALVAGQGPSGRRMAAWVEGAFVHTDKGFGAIALSRVEEPRWEHSDLELAPCDMEVGLRGPQHVVGVTR